LRRYNMQKEYNFKVFDVETRKWFVDANNPDCILNKFIGNEQALRRIRRAAFHALGKNNRDCSDYSFAIFGPPSTGKTYLAKLFARLLGIPFIVIEPRTPVAFSLQELGNLIFQRRLMVPTLGHGAAMLAVWAIPLSFLSVRAEELGAGDIETGLLLGLHLSAFTISNIINSFIGWRVSTKKLVLFAILVFSLGNGIAALSVSFFWLLISGLLSGFGFGFLQSCFLGLSMQGVHPNQRATAMGVHQALYSLGITNQTKTARQSLLALYRRRRRKKLFSA